MHVSVASPGAKLICSHRASDQDMVMLRCCNYVEDKGHKFADLNVQSAYSDDDLRIYWNSFSTQNTHNVYTLQ